MKLWIVGILALLLLLWGLRESFTTYDEALKDVGQTTGYTSLEPKCPGGSTLNPNKTLCKFTDTTKPDVAPSCSSDTLEFVGGVCRRKPQAQSGTATTRGTSAGGTTGGSSDSSAAPNSGGASNRSKQVFGPISNGRGETSGVPGMDSSKTSQYPELMGGGNTKPSTRIQGGDITSPSKSWQLANDGSLPSDGSLGNTENSKYLPFSRQPGDMELIPDPYRVSQQFSSASYSFKTEPVPFLTDFSAFQR